jgi:Outer membrane protein beta-barrel domain
MVIVNARREAGLKVLGAGLSCLSLFVSTDAAAESPKGLYLGAGIGLASFAVEDDSAACCVGSFYVPGYIEGDNATALELNVGYRVSRHLAAELAVFDTSPEWRQGLVYFPELNDVYNNFAETDLQAVELSAVGVLPFGRVWEAYIRGGIAFWRGDSAQTLVRVSDSAIVRRSIDESGADFVVAAGIGVSPRPAWHLRFEWQTFDVDRDLIGAQGTTTLDVMQFGFRFHPAARRNPSVSAR